MSIETLDWIFPFIVLAYGALTCLALSLEPIVKWSESRMPEAFLKQLQGHRVLSMICLVVGGFWSLQNLWLKDLPPIF